MLQISQPCCAIGSFALSQRDRWQKKKAGLEKTAVLPANQYPYIHTRVPCLSRDNGTSMSSGTPASPQGSEAPQVICTGMPQEDWRKRRGNGMIRMLQSAIWHNFSWRRMAAR
jgi:hypothetical protein